MRSGWRARTSSSARTPPPAVITSNPATRRESLAISAICGSSSTIRIFFTLVVRRIAAVTISMPAAAAPEDPTNDQEPQREKEKRKEKESESPGMPSVVVRIRVWPRRRGDDLSTVRDSLLDSDVVRNAADDRRNDERGNDD